MPSRRSSARPWSFCRATASPPRWASAVLADNPVSYWRLDESSGTNAADSKGSNTGTYTNGPTLNQPGALAGDADTAVSFDGSDDYVTVPNSARLNITSAIINSAQTG